MAYVFNGDNPTQLYLDALVALLKDGGKVSPQGKPVKEIRPVIFEYTNPTNKVTFLKGRTINPFFQLAEALWIMAGRSDVGWLTQYNRNMASFSDDGKTFNAPYGERLRFWNKSDANKFIHNPMDQLLDVVNKINKDPYTRQAVAVIYNPIFDHALKETLDRPCNLILTFKLRDNKLDITVFNRSNDLHWGVFGANLCQFATIQEAVASWLDVEVGTYRQITDSLHIYLDDFGAKETDKVLEAYQVSRESVKEDGFNIPETVQFEFPNSPKFSGGYKEFNENLLMFFEEVDPFITLDASYETDEEGKGLYFHSLLDKVNLLEDEYMKMTAYMMVAYQAHKRKKTNLVCKAMSKVQDCNWKVAGLRFLSKRHGDSLDFKNLYKHLAKETQDYIERKEG